MSRLINRSARGGTSRSALGRAAARAVAALERLEGRQLFSNTAVINGKILLNQGTAPSDDDPRFDGTSITMYLDANNNAKLDSGERSVTTTTGLFSIGGLAAGNYLLRQVVPAGYGQIQPYRNDAGIDGSAHAVLLADGDSTAAIENLFFDSPADGLSTIKGQVVVTDQDNPGDGDDGNPFTAAPVTVYLDRNDDGVRGSDEPAITTATGDFAFDGLPAGDYLVREVVPAGYRQVVPEGAGAGFDGHANGFHVGGGDPIQAYEDVFYNKALTGSAVGQVNVDLYPQADVTVYADLNKNGRQDAGEPSDKTGSHDETDGVPNEYQLAGLPVGSVDIRATLPAGYVFDGPGVRTVTIAADQTTTVPDLSELTTSVTINGTVDRGTSQTPLTGQSVQVFLDTDNDGVVDAGERTTTTSSGDGTFSFTGLTLGTYHVRQVVPAGFAQSFYDYTDSEAGGEGTTGPATLILDANDYGRVTFVDQVTAPKLTGTAIGTSGSYNNGGNTIAKALDGSLTTFFDGPSANGNTVGLDLGGGGATITQLAYASRSGLAGRMNGGYFQASNSATFATGNVTLFTIPSNANPPSSSLTTQTVSATGSYRYVRYVSPNGSYGDVAEVQFFGTATPTTGTAVQLTGTTFGTSGSYANSGNTIAKATDGNLSTYFDGPTANGNTVGLDLGTTRVVSQIKFAPRGGYASRMVGGVFQASNSSTFASGVATVYTVGSAPAQGQLTTATVTNTTAYRYWRYVAPNGSYGDIAELQLFGTGPTLAQLSGTPFGTSGSYANSGNTIAKATDGNLSTFFDGPSANGNVVGLDLGSAKVVSQIRFAPRSGYASRMVGGVFQASNSANFSSGVVSVYTVGTAPAQGQLTNVGTNQTTAYRYWRYVAPNGSYGDIAEFQLFG